MRKSEFKKLKVGDTVRLRTLEEIKQLKCYDEVSGGIIDDEGLSRAYLTLNHPHLLGKTHIIEVLSERGSICIPDDKSSFHLVVVRQHLKGRE